MPSVDSNLFGVAILSADVPAYIAALSPFETLRLPTPQNGNATVNDVLPAAWKEGYPNNNNIIVPWSGGTGNGPGKEFFVHGGGHNDSANNALVRFRLGGDPWLGAELVYVSDPSDVIPNSTYADGAPPSTHTYEGCFYYDGSFWRVGGSGYSSGGTGNDIWKHDGVTWFEESDSIPSTTGVAAVALKESHGKIIILRRSGGSGFFWNVATNEYTSFSSTPHYTGDAYGSAVGNQNTGEVLLIQSGRAVRWMPDWDAGTISGGAEVTLAGDAYDLPSAPLLFWDSVRDSYWAYGGHSAADYANIYEITGPGTTKMVTRTALTGGDLPVTVPDASAFAMYGRGVLMEAERAIGFLTHVDQPPWLIRIP